MKQTAGIEQVDGVVAGMDDATRRNAALVGQSAAAAQAMRDEAEALARLVGPCLLDERPGLAHAAATPAARLSAT